MVYRWSGGVPQVVGTVTDAHLRAWEYELVAEAPGDPGSHAEKVSLWRTRRPDLAPPELWLSDEIELTPRA